MGCYFFDTEEQDVLWTTIKNESKEKVDMNMILSLSFISVSKVNCSLQS